jgi:hypothetical protein
MALYVYAVKNYPFVIIEDPFMKMTLQAMPKWLSRLISKL